MKTIKIKFKNRPNEDGTLSTFEVPGCLIAMNGAPVPIRPQIIIHLPKTCEEEVIGAWVEYAGGNYHVTGMTVPSMEGNTPTSWNRYAIASKIY